MNGQRDLNRKQDDTGFFIHDDQPEISDMTFSELFRGVSVWRKIIGGAVAGPVMVTLGVVRGRQRGQFLDNQGLLTNPMVVAGVLIATAIIGAAVGAALALKEVVQLKSSDLGSSARFLKAIFGMGKWSLLLFWVPMMTAAAIIVVAGVG